jgi:hypothetical protein
MKKHIKIKTKVIIIKKKYEKNNNKFGFYFTVWVHQR